MTSVSVVIPKSKTLSVTPVQKTLSLVPRTESLSVAAPVQQDVALVAPEPQTLVLVSSGAQGPPGPQGEPGQSYTTFEYMFDAAAEEPPTANEIRFDNAVMTAVTKVWVHHLSSLNKDNANAFTLTDAGNRFFVQDKDDASRWVSFDATAGGTNQGDYTEFPVTWRANGPSPLAQQRVLFNIATKGTPGPEGPQGPAGPAGADSTVPGPQGLQGEAGAQGPAGPQGPIGADSAVQGPQGPMGPQGIQGSQGVAGTGITAQGSVATSGDLPASGNTQGDAYIVQADDSLWIWDGVEWVSGGSIQGPPGSQGPIGPQGVEGPQGAASTVPGPQGIQGIQGQQGIQGSTGATGADSVVPGPQGPQGIQGIQGIQGETGEQGPSGSGLSTAEYTYAVNTTPPPSTGQLRANSTTQTAITAFYLHETNVVGVDITNALKLIRAGNRILVQDKTNSANFHNYIVSSAVTDNGAYFTIPVTWTDGASSFTAGRVVFALFGLGQTDAEPPIAIGTSAQYWRGDKTWQTTGTIIGRNLTISTSAPSGGSDGDMWCQVAS